MKFDPNALYKRIKGGISEKYDEAVHCPMILDVMAKSGTVSAFCVKAGISDATFFNWVFKYKVFDECYRVGVMASKENWEEEGRTMASDPDWNVDVWKTQGSSRHGVGRTNRIRVTIDPSVNPFEQYQQLIKQASFGEFTASEFKQLMEAINIGIRAYESFKLQEELEDLKADLAKMKKHNGNNIVAIASAS